MKKHFGRIIKTDTLINIFLIFATVIIGVHILSENLIDYESVNQKTIFLRFILQVSSGISIVILSASLSTSINK
ncbi:TPA: hypothetical protein ACGO1N_002170, partial [Streptococcus suis]